MVLGSIKVSDSLPPATASLYGLGRNGEGKFVISDIDTATDAVTEKVVCPHALDGAVTWPTTNRIFGTDRTGDVPVVSGYDFTMRRHLVAESGEDMSDCIIGMYGSVLLPLRMENDLRIRLIDCRPVVSRSLPPVKPYFIGRDIPDDVAAAEFADDRFLHAGKGALMTKVSVTTADGEKYTAIAELDIRYYTWSLGEPTDDSDLMLLQHGYVIAADGERSTVYRITDLKSILYPTEWDVAGRVAGKVVSCACNADNGDIMLLAETDGRRWIGAFRSSDGTYEELCEVSYDMEQIAARYHIPRAVHIPVRLFCHVRRGSPHETLHADHGN